MTENATATRGQHLSGHLGTVGVVFMVVAAAAPLTVIGGNMPLAMGLGNGAGAPVGFLIAALVLLVFSIGFVTMTPYVPEAGAFFSYVTVGLGKRIGTGIAAVALIAYTAIQVGIYGYIGWAIGDTVAFYGGPEIPWPVYSFVILAIVALLGYRHIELSAKVLGVALVLEIGIVLILDLVIVASPGPAGLTLASFQPDVFTQGTPRHRRPVRPHRVHRVRGDRGVPRRGTRSRAHDSPGHVRRGADHRWLLRADVLGVRRRDRPRPGHRGRAAHAGTAKPTCCSTPPTTRWGGSGATSSTCCC